MNADTGKIVILIGLGIVIVGVLIYFFHDKLHWIGRLPGDIRVEKENVRFYFPLTTMILLSLVVSGIWALIRKFF